MFEYPLIDEFSYKFYTVNNQNYIFLQKSNRSYFFFLPKKITFVKTPSTIIFFGCSSEFFLRIVAWFKILKKTKKKKLLLVGLGLKANFNKTTSLLQLKLERSHLIFVKVPRDIRLKIKKNLLYFESSNVVLLGNFVHKIRILKWPNVYKGKGVCFKNEKIKLKQIKKK